MIRHVDVKHYLGQEVVYQPRCGGRPEHGVIDSVNDAPRRPFRQSDLCCGLVVRRTRNAGKLREDDVQKMNTDDGVTPDTPKVANLKDPAAKPVEVMTSAGPMRVDMRKVKAAADAMGIDRHDVFSIPGYRNALGELVPMYEAIRFEHHKPPPKEEK